MIGRGRTWILAAAMSATAAAGAAGAPVVAIQDDQIGNSDDPAVLDVRVDRLTSTGVRWTRIDVDWSKVAPSRPADPLDPDDPAYDWSRYDHVITELARHRVGVMVTLLGTPPWASTSGAWNAAPRASEGGAFAGAVARRYSGRWRRTDGTPLPAIRSISPRNEPNINLMTSPQCIRSGGRWIPDSPRSYAALLRAAYPRIREAAPRMLIVAGETAGAESGCRSATSTVGTLQFAILLHRHLGNTRRVPFDVWAQHMHPVGPPTQAAFFPSWSTLPRLTRILNRMHPRGRMPIVVSETSYATSYSSYHRYFVTESQQAKWVGLTYTLAARHPQVEAVVYFNLQDHRDWPAGLFRTDWTAKPAFEVFRRIARSTPLPKKWASLP